MKTNRSLVLLVVAIVLASTVAAASVAARGNPFDNGGPFANGDNGNVANGLSYVAICAVGGVSPSDFTITVTGTKDGGTEVTAIRVDGDVDSVVVKYATTQKTFTVTGGSVVAGSSVAGGTLTNEPNGGPCPDGQSGLKYELSGTTFGAPESVN